MSHNKLTNSKATYGGAPPSELAENKVDAIDWAVVHEQRKQKEKEKAQETQYQDPSSSSKSPQKKGKKLSVAEVLTTGTIQPLPLLEPKTVTNAELARAGILRPSTKVNSELPPATEPKKITESEQTPGASSFLELTPTVQPAQSENAQSEDAKAKDAKGESSESKKIPLEDRIESQLKKAQLENERFEHALIEAWAREKQEEDKEREERKQEHHPLGLTVNPKDIVKNPEINLIIIPDPAVILKRIMTENIDSAPPPAGSAASTNTGNTNSASAPFDREKEMADYEKERSLVKEFVNRRAAIQRNLANCESRIADLETKYIESTPTGNILTGFDNYLKGTTANASRRKAGNVEQNRVFSRSSISYNPANQEAPTPASGTSTPGAPTPLSTTFKEKDGGGTNAPTPTSATEKKTAATKKKKEKATAATEDSETDSRDVKKIRTHFGATRK